MRARLRVVMACVGATLALAGCGSGSAGLLDATGGIELGEWLPGHTEFASVPVLNRSGAPITFVRVRLLPKPGFELPRLLAVRRGPCCALQYGGDWPSPTRAAADGLRPLAGTTLSSGRQSTAIVDLELGANRPGDYGFSSLAVTVRRDGQTLTFAAHDGSYVVGCLAERPTVRVCPATHLVNGRSSLLGGDPLVTWLRDRSNLDGNGVTPAVHRAYPSLDGAPTTARSYRTLEALSALPVGTTLRADQTPLPGRGDGYFDEAYSPGTRMTLLYRNRRLAIFADDYYGAVDLLTAQAGHATLGSGAEGGLVRYLMSSPHTQPQLVSALFPGGSRTAEVRFADGRRRLVPVIDHSVTFSSTRPFVLLWHSTDGTGLASSGDYAGAPAPGTGP